MAEYLIQEETLTNIANAIRTKTGKSEDIIVSSMADEINDIDIDGAISIHNEDEAAHPYILGELTEHTTAIEALETVAAEKSDKGHTHTKSEITDFPTSMPASDVSDWAKESSKPTYTASEVGALPDTTTIPTKTSDLTNDSGFITGYTETDPTVPSWAKESSIPIVSYSLINGSTVIDNTGLADDDYIPVADTSAATGKKITLANLASYLVSKGYVAGGSATGGVEVAIVVGTVVNWAGYTWIVVHMQDGMTYLALKNIYSTTRFGSSTTYKGSTLATVAANFQNSLPAAALEMCNNVTVEGVTAKVFVPTYAQCNGNFEYYSSNANRIAYYNNTATDWLTSTAHSADGVYFVSTGGKLSTYGPINISGFRPHVALSL